mmetsp:Transcript_39646/g.78034  ORF Transcript_39646/g.78034 Transcript_39646/m.78034 type:complete len:99 (-) Transcript_39646:12291-12587(-)
MQNDSHLRRKKDESVHARAAGSCSSVLPHDFYLHELSDDANPNRLGLYITQHELHQVTVWIALHHKGFQVAVSPVVRSISSPHKLGSCSLETVQSLSR